MNTLKSWCFLVFSQFFPYNKRVTFVIRKKGREGGFGSKSDELILKF